ncbi:MAG TPA: LysE family translocator [Candidatus Krumholzibacteria bacterium]
MPSSSAFALFLAASLALLIVPGPAVMYIVARSIDQGRWAGVVSALGLAAGSAILIVAAAVGVSAVLAASPAAFNAIRYLGAGYLAYLGVRTALARPVAASGEHAPPEPLARVFAEGIVVNLLNPKTALFFFAFLPQFVNPAANVRLQVVVLGMTFSVMGLLTDSVYAFVAGAVGGRLKTDQRFPRVRRVAVATTYMALSVLALLVHPTKG